ncbi:hypothetical protein CTAYLR_006148 [Chrysophaeum taylorii]|uniref:EamA domain-containing protein n=1 Tax=Chrysophaeum taylorii TaxID=2483200 RepID=A0AAD7UP31_9STRA|nr:hypothetical protein CTAYLR_006148 [Chrysophaeum taylorii]
MMRGFSPERKGVVIATAGVVMVTPDAVLLRWASAAGGKLVAMTFWKCLLMGVVCGFYCERSAFASASRRIVACTAMGSLQAVSIILLSYAFVYTYAATAVLCYSMHPLWSAVIGWVFLNDVLPRRTIFALVCAVLALFVMFAPEFVSGNFGGGRNSYGDAMAITTSLTMALFLTSARAASRVAPEISVPLASSFGLLFAAAVLGVAATCASASLAMPSFAFVAIAVDSLAVGAVNIAFSIAPAYITAAQVGLISLVEAVFGPVWVFAIYGEVPPVFTIIGGVMIVAILAAHELTAPREERGKVPSPDDADTGVPAYSPLADDSEGATRDTALP